LRRPTRDIDFRGYVAGNSKTLSKIIHEIIVVSAPEDGLVFNSESISVDEAQLDVDYQGIRVKLTALLERTRIPIQIDIGFSDELSSKVVSIEYPNILPDLKTVHLKGYPRETVVAEKFHAMIRHGDVNSRMKDYYDVWLISQTFEFDGQSLRRAIETTFKNRDTDLPNERPGSLSVEFASANNTRWKNFLEKLDIPTTESADFANIIERIWEFIEHPLQASINKTRSTHIWISRKGWK